MQTNSLEDARKILTTLRNAAEYKLVKIELDSYGVDCCGYTETGRMITIYNNKAQFTFKNTKLQLLKHVTTCQHNTPTT